MTDNRYALSIHHIGARAGTRDFPITFCERDVINVLYEADPSCADQIREAWKSLPSRLVLHTKAVGKASKERAFYVYNNRYLSSLYPLSLFFQELCSYDDQFCWDNDRTSSLLVDTLRINTYTLEEILASCDDTPPPDFLSLDTQGSEYEILQGAISILKANTLVVKTEVSFREIYQGQGMFSAIDALLTEAGYVLTELDTFSTSYTSKGRIPVGLRGMGDVLQGEATYFKSNRYMLSHHQNTIVSAVKLFCLSFLYKRFGQSFELLEYVDNPRAREELERVRSAYAYIDFSLVMADVMRLYPPVFPVRYSALFPPELSARRFVDGASADRHSVRQRWMRENRCEQPEQVANELMTDEFIGLEQLALAVNLEQHAKDLRELRLRQAASILRWVTGTDAPAHASSSQ